MPNAKKELTHQLVTLLEPHLESETGASLAPKDIAKLLRKLAKQVLAQPGKKRTLAAVAKSATPALPVAKQRRQELVATLTSEVAAHVGTAEPLGKPAKALTKAIKRLAKQVMRQQRRQPQASTDPAPLVTSPHLLTTPTPVARPQAKPTARRPAAGKRPAAKAAAVPLSPEAEALSTSA